MQEHYARECETAKVLTKAFATVGFGVAGDSESSSFDPLLTHVLERIHDTTNYEVCVTHTEHYCARTHTRRNGEFFFVSLSQACHQTDKHLILRCERPKKKTQCPRPLSSVP